MRRPVSLRSYLAALAALVFIPSLILTIALLVELYQSAALNYERDVREIARRLSTVVDRELVSAERAMQVLASSALLTEKRYEELQRQALVAKELIGFDVIVKDVTGQQLVNTRMQWGAELPVSLPDADKEALAKAKPTVSDLFVGATSRRPIVSINVPIIQQGKAVGLVNMAMETSKLSELLVNAGVPSGWTAAIVDRKGIIVARSNRADQFVGTMATEDLRFNAVHEDGNWVGSTADGRPVIAGYSRSKAAGWVVAVGVPKEIVEEPLWRWLRFIVIGSSLVFAASLLLVNAMTRPVTRSTRSLVTAATKIGRGEEVEVGPMHIKELAIVGDELQSAGTKIKLLTANLEAQVSHRTRELLDANKKLAGEISHREKIEDQLRQSQKLEAIGQLTGGIAHDFNNLLTVISGSLQMLQRRLARGEREVAERLIGSASEAAKRAAALTERLLAFGRQQPLAPKVLDANALVGGMSELLVRSLGETVQVNTILHPDLWPVHADPNQLENALLNLALNARDAMPQGGKLTIKTENVYLDERYVTENPGASRGEFVIIEISDTGSGMSPEVVAKAFDPFYTTKPPGQGTGLGLSQVYGFARQSGGHIKIYSELGVGTSVKLYLPRGNAPAVNEAVQSRTAEAGRSNLAGMTVLIVEDDDGVSALSADYFTELGLAPIRANGALAALRLLDAHPEIGLVFTDVVMPDMNGRRLADEIKKRRPELPILFTTGYTKNAIVHGGILDPDVTLLPKPFTLEQLNGKLQELFRT